MNPKVSIRVPTYNRKDYLSETFDSILAQTYKDYELVVVDDGSTNGTAEILTQSNYPVRYYWQKIAVTLFFSHRNICSYSLD